MRSFAFICGNIIAFNEETGVTVTNQAGYSVKNSILSNSIFNNGSAATDFRALGIDLVSLTGDVLPNDIKDVDVGNNDQQNSQP